MTTDSLTVVRLRNPTPAPGPIDLVAPLEDGGVRLDVCSQIPGFDIVAPVGFKDPYVRVACALERREDDHEDRPTRSFSSRALEPLHALFHWQVCGTTAEFVDGFWTITAELASFVSTQNAVARIRSKRIAHSHAAAQTFDARIDFEHEVLRPGIYKIRAILEFTLSDGRPVPVFATAESPVFQII